MRYACTYVISFVLISVHVLHMSPMFSYVQVFKERSINQTEFLFDFSDGRLYKEHPLFRDDKNALQLIIYFDEVEVANPLGSYHGVHKLGT